MIRITRQTDYGIVLMSRMATGDRSANGNGAEHHTATELAAEAGLSVPMVSKILKLLTRAGLLISHRGAHGGYQLAREPHEVSVSAMIEALEGPIAMTACVDGSAECDHLDACPTQGNWLTINRAIREVLDGISLADMIGEIDARKLMSFATGAGNCSSGARSTHSNEV